MDRLDVTEKNRRYGTTFKELITRSSATASRARSTSRWICGGSRPRRDRVAISMSGKFLPYKTY